jgi:hypothetical protein
MKKLKLVETKFRDRSPYATWKTCEPKLKASVHIQTIYYGLYDLIQFATIVKAFAYTFYLLITMKIMLPEDYRSYNSYLLYYVIMIRGQ